MALLIDIVDFIHKELRSDEYQDASLNGLQYEGSPEVRKLAVGVDAGHAVIAKAVAGGAQLLIVHHGIFWSKPLPIVGPLKRSFDLLCKNDVSLLAAHLPLDAHAVYGNNALLAKVLELENLEPAALWHGKAIGWTGVNTKLSREEIVQRLRALPGTPEHITELPFGPETPKRICIVSGAAADQLSNFKLDNFDTLISGEPRQFAYHFCKENKLNAFFAGHYATETVGVRALGQALAKRFDVAFEFIDEPTGI